MTSKECSRPPSVPKRSGEKNSGVSKLVLAREKITKVVSFLSFAVTLSVKWRQRRLPCRPEEKGVNGSKHPSRGEG